MEEFPYKHMIVYHEIGLDHVGKLNPAGFPHRMWYEVKLLQALQPIEMGQTHKERNLI